MSMTLPGVLAEIAAVAGEAVAVAVAARVGGTRIYIPARCSDDHWLVDCVGRAAADKICKHFAVDGRGQRLDMPLPPAGGAYRALRRAIAKRVHALDAGRSSSREIAQAAGITQRTVHRHRAAHRGHKDDKQGSLF